MPKRWPKSPPKREGEFRPEIGRNGHFWDLGPSWGLDVGPDSQNHQNDIQNHTRDTQIQPQNLRCSSKTWADYGKFNNKKCGRSALYFLLLGVSFGRQSTGLIEITTKNINIVPKTSLANTMGGTNLVYKPLGGTVAGTAVGIGYIYIYIIGVRGCPNGLLTPWT